MNDSKGIVFLIASFTLLRLGVAPTFGLGVDEAHYLLYAVHLDLSYVDHPPLVGWIHAVFYTFWAPMSCGSDFRPSSCLPCFLS